MLVSNLNITKISSIFYDTKFPVDIELKKKKTGICVLRMSELFIRIIKSYVLPVTVIGIISLKNNNNK